VKEQNGKTGISVELRIGEGIKKKVRRLVYEGRKKMVIFIRNSQG